MRDFMRTYAKRLAGRPVPQNDPSGALVTFEKGDDTRELRRAMGQFATGVTVVTAMSGDTPVGVTANSFTSVSLEPPLVLFCLGKSLGCVEAFETTEHFVINLLRSDQQAISNRFATKGIDRFQGTPWCLSQDNVPVIEGALASIECSKNAQFDGGDHTIFIGKVKRAQYVPGHDPLLYFGGDYRQINQA
ncbi:MAG: flavin reductase family protein [Pseudomonadota bacterium]